MLTMDPPHQVAKLNERITAFRWKMATGFTS
jgi:hypothetical protein